MNGHTWSINALGARVAATCSHARHKQDFIERLQEFRPNRISCGTLDGKPALGAIDPILYGDQNLHCWATRPGSRGRRFEAANRIAMVSAPSVINVKSKTSLSYTSPITSMAVKNGATNIRASALSQLLSLRRYQPNSAP